jgi:Flp pilus assembly protein TadB
MSVLAAVSIGMACALGAGALMGTLPHVRRPRVRVDRSWALGIGAGAVSALVVAVITGSVLVAVVPACAVGALPQAMSARRDRARRRLVQAAWPDGLRELTTSLASGRPLRQAVNDLAAHGPVPLRAPFAQFPQLAPMLGVVPALELVKAELADATSDRIIEVLVLAHDRGGAIVREILTDLTDATTRDLRVLEEIDTDGLEMRINARAVVAMPWFVLVALTARAGPFRSFYRSAAGGLVLLLAVGLTAIGVSVLRRLGREPVEPRVLRSDGYRIARRGRRGRGNGRMRAMHPAADAAPRGSCHSVLDDRASCARSSGSHAATAKASIARGVSRSHAAARARARRYQR